MAIAADTQSAQGNLLLPGDSTLTPDKIQRIGSGYIGLVGSSAHHDVIRSLGASHPELFDFSSAGALFESFRAIQKRLVDDYHLRTDEDDREQEYDSNQMFGIVISRSGLFSFQSYREVSEMTQFWAAGSGAELAIGSMESTYKSARSARAIALEAVRVACRFDKDCGLPATARTLTLTP